MHTEEYLITLCKHISLFSLSLSSLFSPRTPQTTQQMASVQPQVSSTGPGLFQLRGSPPLPHTQLWPTAGLVPGQMKTHTITHSSPGLERERERKRGGRRPCFDWTADSELCLKFFHLNSVGDIQMRECEARLRNLKVKNWVFCSATLSLEDFPRQG